LYTGTGKVLSQWEASSLYQHLLSNPVTGTGTSGQVAVWTGSNTQTGYSSFFWDATNNNLGVGTNTPNSSFGRAIHLSNSGSSGTVADNASFIAQSTNRNANYYSWIPSTGSAGYQVQSVGGGTTYGSFVINSGTGGIYNNSMSLKVNSNFVVYSDINGNTNLYANSTGSLNLFTNNNQRVQVDATGNMAVGSNTISGLKLAVNGSVGIGTSFNDGINALQVNGYAIATGYKIPSGTSTASLMADGSTLTLKSGTYTPTISNLVNCSSVVTTGSGVYTRVGNIVNFTCAGLMTTSATGSNASFMFTPPIAFTSLNQYVGIICINPNGGTQSQAGQVVIPSSGTTIEATFPLPSTTGALASWTLTIQYTL
jgi:hypothetical protein